MNLERIQFRKLAKELCAVAKGLRTVSTDTALEYLIDKLLTFLSWAEDDPDAEAELPGFVAAIRRMFTPEELRGYLDRLQRKRYRVRRLPPNEADYMDLSLESTLAAKESVRFYHMRELLEQPS